SPALFSLCVSSFTTPAPPELHPLSLHDALPIFPTAALIAYSATLVANTARITIALLLRQSSVEIGWLSPDQLHRFEGVFIYFGRSEEHTSELQSLTNLVCRLLLEKKKNKAINLT